MKELDPVLISASAIKGLHYPNGLFLSLDLTKPTEIFEIEVHIACPKVFGHLKGNIGYKQFLLRGYEKVNAELKLMAIGWNIKKSLHQVA